MKICVAQTIPIKGDFDGNSINHLRLVDLAIHEGVEVIIFPELSITGYEPSLVKELATTITDPRWEVFQKKSDQNNITIGVGFPLLIKEGVCISMAIFSPQKDLQVYSKKYLHDDELPYFVSGENESVVINHHPSIALAICYEISIKEQVELANSLNSTNYIASVAKSEKGVIHAYQTLANTAKKYGMTVLMSNCFGPNDDFVSTGQSAVWNADGELLGNLDSKQEGILIWDTSTNEIVKKYV